MLLKYLLLLLTPHYAYSGLPSFIHKCSRQDKNLNACILEAGNQALPTILKGIPQLNIPSFLPYNFGTIKQELSPNVYFYYEGKIYNTGDPRLYMAILDEKNMLIHLGFTSKKVLLNGNFTISGTLNKEPLLEKGNANFTYSNPKFHYIGKFEYYTKDKATYARIKNSTFTLMKYDSFKDNLYNIHLIKPHDAYIRSESGSSESDNSKHASKKAHSRSDSGSKESYNWEPAITAAVCKLGNKAVTSVLDIFASLAPVSQSFTNDVVT